MPLELGTLGEEMNLTIRQGATFGPFTAQMVNPDGSPVDLTGSVIRGQIRKKASDTVVVANLTFVIDPGTNGTYSFSMPWEQTAALPCGESIQSSASQYVHDIEMQDSADRVTPLYYGKVSVFREVTRS